MDGSRSLLRTIAVWLALVMVGAVTISGLLFYWQFENFSFFNREQTLRGQVELLVRAIQWQADGGIRLVVPPQTAALFDVYGIHYAVLDEHGKILAASPGIDAPLTSPMPLPLAEVESGIWPFKTSSHSQGFFINKQLDGGQLHYGVSRKVFSGDHFVWAQVASTDQEMFLDSEVEEYIDHVGWFWLPLIVLLMAVNLTVIHLGMRPLRLASLQAKRIGPGFLSGRLPVDHMPKEFRPLVEAVNDALDRVEAGYNSQRDFLADAAHELRTPLAVLKAHLSILEDRDASTALLGDLAQLERLVSQLLDVARLEVMRIADNDETDLHALAVDVAGYLAPLAIERHRSIELVGSDHPVLVKGAYDFLFRALRNVVENALAHTPLGTTVTIAVDNPATLIVTDHGSGIPQDQRRLIFERFWQGRRDRSDKHGGAGLGMAIVARTVNEHGGTVEIDDAPDGGARFIMRFPPRKGAL